MTFRPRLGKQGVEMRLHDLEAEIMDIVWSRDFDRFAVSDVLAVLEKRRSVAYTTVMTTLVRLFDKGVLKRHKDGKKYLYEPAMPREAFLQQIARDVFEGIGGSATGAPSFFLLAETVSTADAGALDELERLIELRRRELGS